MNNFVKWDKKNLHCQENLHKVYGEMPILYLGFYLRIYSFNSNLPFSISLRMHFTNVEGKIFKLHGIILLATCAMLNSYGFLG